MKSVSALVFVLLYGLGCSASDDQPGVASGDVGGMDTGSIAAEAPYAGEPEVIDDSILRFPGGAEYKPGFRNITYIGQIPADTRAPFIIIGGVECAYCDAPPTVLMRSPSDGPVKELRSLPGWYPYPGRILASDDPTVVLSEARVFWGECLPGEPPGLLYYHTEFVDDGPGQRSVQATLVRGDSLVSADGPVPWSSIEDVLEVVSRDGCIEIEPEDRFGDP